MHLAIKVENLSKAYQIGQFTSGTLSRDIERWWALALGKEDPFLKIGETNDQSKKGKSDIIWSLKDINIEIEQGDAVGIIGKNGAGKSTLLKVLSQVTTPTAGKVKMRGRVASLLEVGTGFHNELTGRENIYLNGTILGMRKSEITRKFDEIVEFSGVERYIDTPVKRYSSGMYVRLAFAVAAHLENEILLVDEVLAVGDAEFQKKCLSKMSDVSKSGERTILFVSHNMKSITSLCEKSILLEKGRLKLYQETNEVVENYLNPENRKDLTIEDFRITRKGPVRVISIEPINNLIFYNKPIVFEILIESYSTIDFTELSFCFGLWDDKGNFVCNSQTNSFSLYAGQKKMLRLILAKNKYLVPGKYRVGFNLMNGSTFSHYESFDIANGYPEFELLIDDDIGDGFQNIYKWNQGWGSILFESSVQEMT